MRPLPSRVVVDEADDAEPCVRRNSFADGRRASGARAVDDQRSRPARRRVGELADQPE